MRPVILAGHSRPVTQLKYNREGDLLFTAAKDRSPMVWRTQGQGERLGTYDGHQGAINSLDVSYDSEFLITGSADNSAVMWSVETGESLFTWNFQSPVRSVSISPDGKYVALTTSTLMKSVPEVHIMRLTENPADMTSEEVATLKGPTATITRALWTATGEHIIGVSEDGTVRKWDAETSEETDCKKEHNDRINDLQLSGDGLNFITASGDKTAKLWDLEDLQVLKVYTTERPVNAAAISSLMDHVLLGGGQDASQVTTTGLQERFDARFFHKIFESEIGSVRGHFGPINAVSISPDGKQFVTGGEESMIRIHNFDEEYFKRRYD